MSNYKEQQIHELMEFLYAEGTEDHDAYLLLMTAVSIWAETKAVESISEHQMPADSLLRKVTFQ